MATKTTSVRAEEENIERFDKLAEEYNITKTELFPKLLEAFEEKNLKEKVPGRADEIDAFKTVLKQLHDLYFSSVNMAVLAKTTAERELRVELETRTRTIADLQAKQDELKERIEQLEKALDSSNKEINDLQEENANLKKTIADKDVLIQSLRNSQAAVNAVEAFNQVTVFLEEIMEKQAEKEETQYNKLGERNENLLPN